MLNGDRDADLIPNTWHKFRSVDHENKVMVMCLTDMYPEFWDIHMYHNSR
jgi:hypothetical protein